ncbi:MAG: histidine--tRNA ligase [Endomicrobium sp.]|jgi:histidyl-tRNA synthetase|nr:histidine--tRNA ligase [Endomicrobium sp.]
MKYKAQRGTHDIFGINALGMSLLEQKSKEVFKKYGFEEIRTPIFEDVSLFIRSMGKNTDVVEKEMYVFKDRNGKKLALRPEGTASLVRAFIEHRMDIYPERKFFYIGEMFRYERPQAGRYRQFYQIGAEFYGSSSPAADAKIILLAHDLLSVVGIKGISVRINSLGCDKCRPLFRDALVKHFNSVKGLCDDCVKRLEKNPLRVLDCKVDSSKFIGVPQISHYLCGNCKDNFNLIQSLLDDVNCSYIVDEKLVRGLDYYTRTVFEIHSDFFGSSRDVLAAGGRYDNLVKELGGRNIAAVGFALGSERVLLASQNAGFFDNFQNPEKIFIAIADQKLFNEAFNFAIRIMRNGLKNNKDISVFGPTNGKSLTSQLKFADKIQSSKTIIFAKTEFENGKVLIKNMKNRNQTEILINDL